jgi:hypothetical protein
MITVNTTTVVPAVFGRFAHRAALLLVPSPVAALLSHPRVLSVRPCSVELFLPVSDLAVRRSGHEAVARVAQELFALVDQQFVVVVSAVGSPVDEPGNSAWGLRVVVVLDEDGAPLLPF